MCYIITYSHSVWVEHIHVCSSCILSWVIYQNTCVWEDYHRGGIRAWCELLFMPRAQVTLRWCVGYLRSGTVGVLLLAHFNQGSFSLLLRKNPTHLPNIKVTQTNWREFYCGGWGEGGGVWDWGLKDYMFPTPALSFKGSICKRKCFEGPRRSSPRLVCLVERVFGVFIIAFLL